MYETLNLSASRHSIRFCFKDKRAFAQAEGIQRVHPMVMWVKFENLAEGAKLLSRELWG